MTAAFPSACGKTNFAMLIPPAGFEGWKVWTVGDDIAWIKPDAEGRLRAINPEAGFFGVAPGTSWKTNPNAMATLSRNTIFTNVALTPEGGVWWEGMTDEPPAECLDWQGSRWTPADRQRDGGEGRAPQLTFHRPRLAMPDDRPGLGRPGGRADRRDHLRGPPRHDDAARLPGVQLERRRLHRGHRRLGDDGRRGGRRRQVRRDPMAMLPFCGYHMGDYFRHWIRMQRALSETPRIFHVNWFRKDADGEFLWPGFRENMRVLKWIVDRARGRTVGKETPIGWMPRYEDIEWRGLDFPKEKFEQLQAIDRDRLAVGSARARGALHRLARPPPARDGVRARTPDLPALVAPPWRPPSAPRSSGQNAPAARAEAVLGACFRMKMAGTLHRLTYQVPAQRPSQCQDHNGQDGLPAFPPCFRPG